MKFSSCLVVCLFGIAILSESVWGFTAQVNLKSKLTGKFVCTDLYNQNLLIANRGTPGAWEKFSFNLSFNQTAFEFIITLRSNANNKYVSAENAGTAPLVANRNSTFEWERFVLKYTFTEDGITFAAQSKANGKYVRVRSIEDPVLEATSDFVGDAESFTIEQNF